MLAWTIYVSFMGAAVVFLLGRDRAGLARGVALLTSSLSLALALVGTMQLDDPGRVNTIIRLPWVPSLGISFFLAADGINCTLLILTGIASVAGVLFSWNIEKRVNEFFAL